ncbi:MAG: hypothetical protein Q9163_005915 [Psora crenata]
MDAQIYPSIQEYPQSALPRAYAVEDDEDNSPCVRMIVHQSCSKCKHFNKHRSFQIPRDQSRHKRLQCERCGYHMIGIGRSSTQTTLASVESIPSQGPEASLWRTVRMCTDQNRCSDDQHIGPLPPSSSARLASLIKPSLRPTIQSPLREETQPPTDQLAIGSVHEKDEEEPPKVVQDTNEEASIGFGNARKPRYPFMKLTWFRVSGGRIKNKLLGKLRVVGKHGHRLWPHGKKDMVPGSISPEQEGVQSDPPHLPSPRNEAAPQKDSEENMSSRSRNQYDGSQRGNAEHIAQGKAQVQHCPDEAMAGDPTANMSRLSIIRRETTLKRRALQETQCKCTPDCHCNVDASSSSHSGNSRYSVGMISSQPLERLMRDFENGSDGYRSHSSARHLYTDHIGIHIADSQRISEMDLSNSTPGSSQSFSQATTLRSSGSAPIIR